MSLRFSVIIPIYNSEKTLERCIKSLLHARYPDVEIILINDGSSDSSGSICETYAARYPFVKYIYKENGGVSSARNRGIDEAGGEWILFVDSDDHVTKNYFAIIDEYLHRYPCDLLAFGNYYQRNGKVVKKNQRFFYSSDPVSSRRKISEMICRKTINSPWGKAYRGDIIRQHEIDFTEGVSIAEDRAFNIKYALYISGICTIPDRLYCTSLDNPESLSRKKNGNNTSQFSKAAMDIKREIEKSGLSDSDLYVIHQALAFCEYRSVFRLAKELNRDGVNREERIKKLKQACRKWKERGLDYPDLLYCHLLMMPVKYELVSLLDLTGWILTR